MSSSDHQGRIANIPIIDGWRAVSILLVLGGHWVPMWPSALRLNDTAGAAGMALFFTLSGFLIVSFLAAGAPLGPFLMRRAARIVPLAWLAVLILATWQEYDLPTILENLLFVSNLPPANLLEGGQHLWSLGVEMQFYLLAALLCLALGRTLGLGVVPLLCVSVTVARILAGETISIVTWHRIDEVLAGGTVALVYAGRLGRRKWLQAIPTWPMLAALVIVSDPLSGPFQYARPYAAALLVGSTLVTAPRIMQQALTHKIMIGIAQISYAVYVIHGVLTYTWLGAEPNKYLKRPVLFICTFVLAYISTRYYERPIIHFIRGWEKRWAYRRVPSL